MTEKKSRLRALYRLCPRAHVLLIISLGLIALHLLTRDNYALMRMVSENIISPLHQKMALACSYLGTVSLAEMLIAIFVLGLGIYIVCELIFLLIKGERLKRLYRMLVRLLAVGFSVYAGYSLLWGVYYYGDDFITASGLESSEISLEQLETVTVYFAQMLNDSSDQVQRDEKGLYVADREEILRRSSEVYRNIEKQFPCLEGPDIDAKGLRFSRVLSYMDFTGFFFPFTAEANVNTDYPPGTFAATVAHELAHQRGVAKEQEANFVAVLSSLDYGDADYVYSACMLAYIHLGNALHKADYNAWYMVYSGLEENVRKDLKANSDYWEQFDTPVQTVSTTVYEGFLQSYDQTMGMKSYGACVDLLVNYYYDDAAAHFGL